MSAVDKIVGVAVAVVGIAIVAVLVSKNSQTSQVIQSGGSAFADIISTAVGPVSQGTRPY